MWESGFPSKFDQLSRKYSQDVRGQILKVEDGKMRAGGRKGEQDSRSKQRRRSSVV